MFFRLIVPVLLLICSLAFAAPGISSNQTKIAAAVLPPHLKDWSARAVEVFGCRNVTWEAGEATITNGVITIVNKGELRKHVMYSPTVLTGNFVLTVQVKGGDFIGLVRADSKPGFLGLQIPGNAMRSFVIERSGPEIIFTVDGYQQPYRKYDADESTDFLFGIILKKGKTCEINGFSLNAKPVAVPKPGKSVPGKADQNTVPGKNKVVLKK